MNNKKIFMYFAIIMLIMLVLGIGWITIKNHNNNPEIKEYTPEEEITTDQLRRTNIVLYFANKTTGEVETEIRQIDSKLLLENPEKQIIKFLIEGPTNESLTKLIPEGTKLINTQVSKGVLYIDFSEDFINVQNLGKEEEEKIIKSIVCTVTKINEINGIKILINGEENKEFLDGGVNFKELFTLQV